MKALSAVCTERADWTSAHYHSHEEQKERADKRERVRERKRDEQREREKNEQRERHERRERERESRIFLFLLSNFTQNFVRVHSCLVMLSRLSKQEDRWGPWSWYGHWEPLNDADQSWTWSANRREKLSGSWSPGRKRNGPKVLCTLAVDGNSSVLPAIAQSWKLFSVFVDHSQRNVLRLSGRNLQPRRRLELKSSSDSLPLLETLIPWQVTKLCCNVIWPRPENKGPRAPVPSRLKTKRSQSRFLAKRVVSSIFLRTLKRPNSCGGTYNCPSVGRGAFG